MFGASNIYIRKNVAKSLLRSIYIHWCICNFRKFRTPTMLIVYNLVSQTFLSYFLQIYTVSGKKIQRFFRHIFEKLQHIFIIFGVSGSRYKFH